MREPDRAEVAELLTTLLQPPAEPVVIDLVYRRSEGIPYFVEELAPSAARGCIDMPDTLRDALNVRVAAPVRRGAATPCGWPRWPATGSIMRCSRRSATRRPPSSKPVCGRRSTRRC